MIDWLYNTVYGLYGRVSGAVKDLIHAVVNGLIGALNAVAGNMWTTWWYMVSNAWNLFQALGEFGLQVWRLLWYLVNTFGVDVIREIGDLYNRLARFVRKVATDIASAVESLAAKAWQWVQDAAAWVVQHVWVPLKAAVDDLYDKMTRWAYTAYYYVTHPDALAEVLFWSLWGVFTRNAWAVARTVGDWALKTVLTNMVSSAQLVEQVITDVL